MIEGMATLSAATRPRAPRSPLPSSTSTPIQFLHARTYYGHLAGEMAVKVLEACQKARWLTPRADFTVTRHGETKLTGLGVDLAAARGERRVFARACVDLTQRRPHLGGALGAALLDLYVARG